MNPEKRKGVASGTGVPPASGQPSGTSNGVVALSAEDIAAWWRFVGEAEAAVTRNQADPFINGGAIEYYATNAAHAARLLVEISEAYAALQATTPNTTPEDAPASGGDPDGSAVGRLVGGDAP